MSKTTVAEPLTPEEFAKVVKIHPESVRRAIRDHRIKAVKVGAYWRIPCAEAERILSEGMEPDSRPEPAAV